MKKPREQRARRSPAPYYRERATGDLIAFIRDAARLEDRAAILASPPIPYALAWSFRKRIYYWRRSVLDTLANVETEQWRECVAFLEATCGPRVNAEWLNLLALQVERLPGDTGRVVAFLKPVCYGPDIRFADHAATEDAAGIEAFRQALVAQRATGGPSAAGEPTSVRSCCRRDG